MPVALNVFPTFSGILSAMNQTDKSRNQYASTELLTVEQAANFLQLSCSSIRSYIRQGKLQAFRVAGLRKVLIPHAALLALLEPTAGLSRNSFAAVAGNP